MFGGYYFKLTVGLESIRTHIVVIFTIVGGLNTFERKCMYVVRPVATLEFQTCFSTQHKDLWRVNGIIPSYAIWPEHVTYTGQILA